MSEEAELNDLRGRELLRCVQAGGHATTGKSNPSGNLWERTWIFRDGEYKSMHVTCGSFFPRVYADEGEFVEEYLGNIGRGAWFHLREAKGGHQ